MRSKKIILTVFAVLMTLISFGQQLTLEVLYTPVFYASQFNVSEAGNDLTSIVDNNSGHYISINSDNYWFRKLNRIRWKVNISKYDSNWHPLLNLEVVRSGNGYPGSGSKNIRNGTSYRNVTDLPKYFFKGVGAYLYIPINFRLTNVSVLIPADYYETTIIYTVIER